MRLSNTLRRGLIVIALLAFLSIVEYAIPAMLEHGSFPYLVVIAAAKAWLILWYFMHVAQVWRREESRHGDH